MVKEYQVTLMCASGKYKPVSCIIKNEEVDLTNKDVRTELVKQGTQKICIKKYWSSKDLKKYGYTKAKIREYDKQKIAEESAARYEAIKEAKYASGEWKRPKGKD